jgi:Domain of unknown function (DUF6431)
VCRFRCPECEKTFTLLPDFLVPFKHYVVEEIEGVLRHLYDGGKITEAPSAAEESTLRLWWNEYSHKMQEWAGLLESEGFKLFNRASGLITPSMHALNRLEAALSRLPSLPSRWTVMVKTLWWLKSSYPL